MHGGERSAVVLGVLFSDSQVRVWGTSWPSQRTMSSGMITKCTGSVGESLANAVSSDKDRRVRI